MKKKLLLALLITSVAGISMAQITVDTSAFSAAPGVKLAIQKGIFGVRWPAGNNESGSLQINLDKNKPVFHSFGIEDSRGLRNIAGDLDPVFLLSTGKRDLISQNGWNIFFDKVPLKPHRTDLVTITKKNLRVTTTGSRTVIAIDELSAPGFTGNLEITLYNGSPLVNIAAVVTTQQDSTAILYDAGLVSQSVKWSAIGWSNVYDTIKTLRPNTKDTAVNQAVKYRTITGETANGTIAVFPAPHQYFYPLDEAFNLNFTWYGPNYRQMVKGYGIGIRQDLYGDNRFVPWFNSPPGTKQRLNFFCLLSRQKTAESLEQVKRFTRSDSYARLDGYKTLASHFHNEFIMTVVRKNKPIPDTPSFVTVFKKTGIDIVHLGEFHYTAHPKGPDSLRLPELEALFEQCRRLSNDKFLLLPGEEPNEFLGGHWMNFFPKPVYWIMSRKEGQPFVTQDPKYGKVYRIRDAAEMLKLLEEERGLAWTAHPRTKGSTGYPDKYRDEAFFKSPHFLGGAWKPIPADLSIPRLGQRVLDLQDDMNNWGTNKRILAEADLFTIEPENEMYAHLNVNYLQLDKLPSFDNGWQPVLDAMQKGKFFSTTGEVLIPGFRINNASSGDTALLNADGSAEISFDVQWTFPLAFAEIISGDGNKVYRHRINLDTTTAFGKKNISLSLNLAGRKWARLEVWDAAVNGAFTQTIYLGSAPGRAIHLADPAILRSENKYYLYGTVEADASKGFLCYTSDDLTNWKKLSDNSGFCLQKPEVFGTKGFWAPQVFSNNGKLYMAYTANENIAIAQSDAPRGPFTQADKKNLNAPVRQIDPFVFIDDDGKKYLYHVRLEKGNRIFVAEMNDDLSAIKPSTLKECIVATEPWENTASAEWPVAEGPSVFKVGSTYVLFYTANDFRNPDYAVGYATSRSPLGPWVKHSGNPVISRKLLGVNGTGHGDFFRDGNNDLYYVFHTHYSNEKPLPRKTAIIRAELNETAAVPRLRFLPETFRMLSESQDGDQ